MRVSVATQRLWVRQEDMGGRHGANIPSCRANGLAFSHFSRRCHPKKVAAISDNSSRHLSPHTARFRLLWVGFTMDGWGDCCFGEDCFKMCNEVSYFLNMEYFLSAIFGGGEPLLEGREPFLEGGECSYVWPVDGFELELFISMMTREQ